jgi:hypothetical protein
MTAIANAWTSTPTATATTTPTPTQTSTPTKKPTATRRPTNTSTPSPTIDPNRFYSPDGDTSLILPEGWKLADENEDEGVYSVIGPISGNSIPRLVFMQTKMEFPLLGFFTAMIQDGYKDNLENYRQIGEEFLTTEDGKEYLRWEIEFTDQGRTRHEVFYFYESGDWMLTVLFSRLRSEGATFDDLVDESMKTVEYVH